MPHIAGHVAIPGGFNQGGASFPGQQIVPQIGAPQAGPQQLPQAQFAAQPLPQTGLSGLESALRGGLSGSLGALQSGINLGRGDIREGGQGLDVLSAQSGLLGPEAQAAAFQNFQDSPGQAFLREQGEQALIRNQGAIGGLGGGNVRRELARQGIGFAAQDFGNQFQRGLQTVGAQQQTGRDLAGLAAQGGTGGANLISQAAGGLGQARLLTGQQLAQAAGGTTASLANLQNQLGQGQANVFGQSTTNLANLLSGTGQASSQLQQQLATILANIGTGTGSALSQPIQLAAQFDAAGTSGQNAAVQNALQQLLQVNASGGFGTGQSATGGTNFGGGSGQAAFNAGAIA